MHDLRHAIRALRTAPIVSAVAIVSLTLGIGANIAVFSIVNAVLLKPPPYPDPDRIVLLGYTFSGASVPVVSETKLNVWKEQADAAWQDVAGLRSRRLNVSDGSRTEQVLALQTNTDFFRLFGARAALGRVFTDAEDRPGGDRVALLSDGFWKRRFGADPAVVGKRLRIDGTTATIVGVLNADVDTAIFDLAPDVWIPLHLDPTTFSMTVLSLFGACALLLAATGLYGVITYSVQQRRYEIAVRLALGGRWYQIRNMVLLDGLKLASCGVALGVATAAALLEH